MSWREDLKIGSCRADKVFVGPWYAGLGQESTLVCLMGRLTAAQVNADTRAGSFIAVDHPGVMLRVIDAKMRAIGGAVTGTTVVRITNNTDVVISFTQASMTENTWVGLYTAGVVSTNMGIIGTVGKGLRLGCTVADVATATHIDYMVQALVTYNY